jgi:hypothetical protein
MRGLRRGDWEVDYRMGLEAIVLKYESYLGSISLRGR